MFALHGQMLCWPYTTAGMAVRFNHASKIKGEYHTGSVPWKKAALGDQQQALFTGGRK